MADILHDFPIKGRSRTVFAAVATSAGLNAWWTKECSGSPEPGVEYALGFGPGFDWRAVVTQCARDRSFELQLTSADNDWRGSRVGFNLIESDGVTQVRFHHLGWPETNDHYRTSCYCWAMYLRLLRLYVEKGTVVPYEIRLDV